MTIGHLTRRAGAICCLVLLASCRNARARDDAEGQVSNAAAARYNEAFYREMAERSWRYLDAHYQPTTGFVNATADWYHTTLWDVGSQLLAFVAAKEMGLLPADEFAKRTGKALSTLEHAPLFQDAAYYRMYSTRDGTPERGEGAGWSATDLGRFLVALKVLATREPQFAAQAQRVAARIDRAKVVKDGYLWGTTVDEHGTASGFQEGRIGYEQYVAAGFSRWGADVDNALDIGRNATPVEVLGVPLLGDKRRFDRLLSEPFVLYGIELGLSGEMRELAANVLRAQEARYRKTGQVTMVSEDAMPVEPHYFYYYCVYCNERPFVVGLSSPRQTLDAPRWVSTKAAFGWHALMPSDYTTLVLDHLAPALDDSLGWATGVFEQTGASTDTYDVNTASVLMEIAFYQLRGRRPLMEAARIAR